MKQTIKVKVVVDGCAPTISEDGDWIDLRSAIPVDLDGPTAEMLKKHKGEQVYFYADFSDKILRFSEAGKVSGEIVIVPIGLFL